MPILDSLFGPFLVWPLEYFLPYPYIIEEAFKAVVVVKGPKSLMLYVISGMGFAFSETVIYSLNTSVPLERMFLTSILHSGTFAVIYFFNNKKALWVGLLVAALIHYLFNLFFGGVFF